MSRPAIHPAGRRLRAMLVLGTLLAGFGLLGARAVYLQVLEAEYLQQQGASRYSRIVKDNTPRGMILDRSGAPLAVSTPVDSVWAHPASLAAADRARLKALAAVLGVTTAEIDRLLARHRGREFMYLKRHVTPDVAERVTALEIPGVSLLREYRRYYPLGPVAGHLVGFTNIDDEGQEGVELAYNEILRARPGLKRVLKDLQGNTVEVVESLVLPVPGRDIRLSIDRRIQYLAYRELRQAVETHRARAAAAVVLDARTGEVLALVNEPDFNPNNRETLRSPVVFRNRAVTDLFEPGSTLKPFTIAAALESGRFRPDTRIATAPGVFKVGDKLIHDLRDYGTLTLGGVLEKSSNVGAAKIALALDRAVLWGVLRGVGFGSPTGIGLPGESAGLLNPPSNWVPVDQASLAYGYGISVTPVQLARAYAVLANGGFAVPLTVLARDGAGQPPAARVLSERTVAALRGMLEQVVDSGTGVRAQVADYRVAGKTGTVRKLVGGRYSDDRYVAWFAGMAPASQPRLVMVVMVDEPQHGGYFGGEIAAPVFARVMAGALRLLDISPDAPRTPATPLMTARRGGGGGDDDPLARRGVVR
jgi:cell division protein FtsI (penicillin-binding protein 3)